MSNAIESFVSLLADTTVKATVLLGLAALLAVAARRASAAARHLVWSFALIGTLFLPLLTVTLPHWDWTPPAVHPSQSQMIATVKEDESEGQSAMVKPVPTRASFPARAALFPFIFFVWLSGAAFVLTRLGFSLLTVRTIARAGVPFPDGPLRNAAQAACLALPTPINFRLTDAAQTPMAWGFLRPAVVLPNRAQQWPEAQTRAALLHELAHIQRGDWPLQMLVQGICALYWFHPLVWLAARQVRRESEIACDDLVLAQNVHPADYAACLLQIAHAARSFHAAPAAAVAMAEPSALRRRVTAILEPHSSRSGRTPRMAVIAFLAAMGCACALSVLWPLAAVGGSASASLRGVVIVVDAGHGGMDSGVALPSGVKEKTLDLAIAQKLRAALERRGAKVYMTRNDDTYSTIVERSRLTNQKHANYFVSVHCDENVHSYSEGPGPKVYYHAQNLQEIALADAVSRQMSLATGNPSHILSDKTRFMNGFGVLRGAAMPAVLVECGFMTIPHELAQLQNAQAQERIAGAIASGLSQYAGSHHAKR